jgi:hypothetical protein
VRLGWANVEGFFWVTLLLWMSMSCGLKELGVSAQGTFWPAGSSDSPCICTQPRFMPPAFGEWMAYSAFCSFGEAKKSLLYYYQMARAFWSGVRSYKLKHGVDVLWWDGHAIVLDVEKAMVRSCVKDLLSYTIGWIGDIDHGYCVLVMSRHLHRIGCVQVKYGCG